MIYVHFLPTRKLIKFLSLRLHAFFQPSFVRGSSFFTGWCTSFHFIYLHPFSLTIHFIANGEKKKNINTLFVGTSPKFYILFKILKVNAFSGHPVLFLLINTYKIYSWEVNNKSYFHPPIKWNIISRISYLCVNCILFSSYFRQKCNYRKMVGRDWRKKELILKRVM